MPTFLTTKKGISNVFVGFSLGKEEASSMEFVVISHILSKGTDGRARNSKGTTHQIIYFVNNKPIEE